MCCPWDADFFFPLSIVLHTTGKTLRKWRVPWRYCGLLPWRSSSRRRRWTRPASSATVSDPTSRRRDSRPAISRRKRFHVSSCKISRVLRVKDKPIVLVSCVLRDTWLPARSFVYIFVRSAILFSKHVLYVTWFARASEEKREDRSVSSFNCELLYT